MCLQAYQILFFEIQGFLTKSGLVNPNRVQLIMQELGKMEDQIFKDRQDRELSFKARNKAKRRRERLEQNRAPKWVPEGQFAPMVRFLKMHWNNLKNHISV